MDKNSPDSQDALSFLMPNVNLSDRRYSEILTSIDEIVKATGLDFLSLLPVNQQDALESKENGRVW